MASEATKTIKKVESNKKAKKPVKKGQKGNFFQSIKSFFSNFVKDVKRVTWPTGKQLFSATTAVILFTVCVTIVVGLLDAGLIWIMGRFYS